MIDRKRLVRKHNIALNSWHPSSTLSLGNGNFAVNVDVTGLQSLLDIHAMPEVQFTKGEDGLFLPILEFETYSEDAFPIPLMILSSWGWYSTETALAFSLEDDTSSDYQTGTRTVPYCDGRPDAADAISRDAAAWLFANPRRLNLGLIGLCLDDERIPLSEIVKPHVELDLWTGSVRSRFRLSGEIVEVVTSVHPDRDVVATRVSSTLVRNGRLQIRLEMPSQRKFLPNFDGPVSPAYEDLKGIAGFERLVEAIAHGSEEGRHWVERRVGDATYFASVHTDGLVSSDDCAGLIMATERDFSLCASVEFGLARRSDVPMFEDVLEAAAAWWQNYWTSGAAVSFEGSADPRAHELERRVILSQYQTAVHCAGSAPPQESGLAHNSWHGKFHLEMHWWHAAHFALWGRPWLLERSLGWYQSIVARARATAEWQGYEGARWPKQVGPNGQESPSDIGTFLVWQQPHIIYFAELLWLATRDSRILERYGELVFATAEFMADYAQFDAGTYHLGPPIVPAQESYYASRASTSDPTFELTYWWWGLHVAQDWRVRLGLGREPKWDRVLAGLAPPYVSGGAYTAVGTPPFLVRNDHPSMLMALGFLPRTPKIDPDVMSNTLTDVLAQWDFKSTWGWDYPLVAMCATKLGRPRDALNSLMMVEDKNRYLVNGHVPQFPGALSVYLPANGGLLAAVAMMVAGWVGADRDRPGFPDDGSWQIEHEGFNQYPPDAATTADRDTR